MALYSFTNLTIEMNVKREPLLSQSRKYAISESDKKADIVIPNMEKVISKYHTIHPHLSLGDCEYVVYGSYFYRELLRFNGILLHASCVVKDSFAYLFSAPSGTGKSTHTQLWLKRFEGCKILNDDKPALLVKDDKVYACGTPFSGKADLSANEMYEVKGIAFLERSLDNWIEKMPDNKKIFALYNQTIRPNEKDFLDMAFAVIEKIILNTKIYNFGCNMDLSAVDISYNGMNNEN